MANSTDRNNQMVLVAHKPGSVLYLNLQTQQLMKANAGAGGLSHSPLGRDYWELDRIIEAEGYECLDGVLVEPVDERLILDNSKTQEYMATRDELEGKIKRLIG